MLHNSDGQEVHLLISVNVVLDGLCAEHIGRQSLDGLLATCDRKFLSDSADTKKIVREAINDVSEFMEKVETYFRDKEDGVFLMDIGDDQVSFGVMSALLGSGKVKYAGLKQRADEGLFEDLYNRVERVHGIHDAGSYYQIHSLKTLKSPTLKLMVPANHVSMVETE